MLDPVVIPTPLQHPARLAGSWTRPRYWDWMGHLTAGVPIVAVSLMRVGSHLEWARSEKGPKAELEARLLLGWYDTVGRDVQVSFSLGENGPRHQTLLADPESPPKPAPDASVPVGQLFRFCAPFGAPQIELFGLVLLREQVTGARNGLWHLRPSLREDLPELWREILCYGRAGSATLADDAT